MYIAQAAKAKLLDVYSALDMSDYSNGTFEMGLPQTIGNAKYSLILDNKTVCVRAPYGNEMLDVNLTVNIDASMHGESFMPALLSVQKQDGVTIWLDG